MRAPIGPPRVSTKGSSKNWSQAIVVVTATKKIAKRSSGTTIDHVVRHSPAPSIAAASRYSFGIPWMAARKMMMLSPVPRHTATSATENFASTGSESHCTGGSPTRLSR